MSGLYTLDPGLNTGSTPKDATSRAPAQDDWMAENLQGGLGVSWGAPVRAGAKPQRMQLTWGGGGAG